jgi:branched-chain amino acid transport system substrate-binding protein
VDAVYGLEEKFMKKIMALILALCMVFTLCACGGGEAADSGEKVVKIGVFEPSSGDSASGGKKEILGMQYANALTPEVVIGGETYKVELVYGDNGSSTDKAPSAASSLVSAGVSVVLGSYGSGVSMAGGPKFEEAGIPAIGVTCTNPNVTAGNSYYFRICFLDNFQADVLANFAMDKFDAKVAYCLGESGNEYDQGLIAFFKQVFEAAGGTVITDSFPNGNSDFNSYLNKAKSEGADVIFTPVSIAYAVQIIKQAASLGIEAPFLGSDTLDDNMVLEAIAGTPLQLYVSTFYQEGGAAEFDAGIKEYINNNAEALAANGGNDTISAVTAMGYDAYFVALEAMKKADSGDKAALMQILPSVTYTGVSGAIAFDEIGDAVRDTAYIKTADTANGVWALETVQTGSGN